MPTAAVTCRGRARMLVNPDFVAEHCVRDEHLFLLVMHELWHVLLGHTTLYARPTEAHNIAFDAIINAGLARQHPEAAYRGFFEALNPVDSFPGLLLRPPVGWPHAPQLRRARSIGYVEAVDAPVPTARQLGPRADVRRAARAAATETAPALSAAQPACSATTGATTAHRSTTRCSVTSSDESWPAGRHLRSRSVGATPAEQRTSTGSAPNPPTQTPVAASPPRSLAPWHPTPAERDAPPGGSRP